MKLMKLAMAGVAVLTLCTSMAPAQNSGRGGRLWQPEILRSGFNSRQDAEIPTPAAPQAGQLQLPEGAFLVEGDAAAHGAYQGSAGCGCGYDACNSCNSGCNLFGWLKLGRRHNSCGCDSCDSCGHGFSLFKHNWFGSSCNSGCSSACNSCYQQPVSCCAPRKSFRLFSGNWFGHKSCCAAETTCCDPAPACNTSCDPCSDRGWLDKFLSCSTARDCHYEPSCCEPAPTCNSCNSGCGLDLFGWLKRGHGHGCGCDSCGSGYSCGCGSYGDVHHHAHPQHDHMHQDAVPAPPAVPGELPPGAVPVPAGGNAA